MRCFGSSWNGPSPPDFTVASRTYYYVMVILTCSIDRSMSAPCALAAPINN